MNFRMQESARNSVVHEKMLTMQENMLSMMGRLIEKIGNDLN